MNPWLCNLLFNNSGGSSLPATGQTFYASLKTSLVPEVGTGGPTWSRATAAWRFNDQGYLRQIPSGCAEFGGARLVTNLITQSENFSHAHWVKRGTCSVTPDSAMAPDGTVTADLIEGLLSSSAGDIYNSNSNLPVGSVFYIQFQMKKVTPTGIIKVSNAAGASKGQWNIDLSLIDENWQIINPAHPAVSVITAFSGSGPP